MQGQNTYGNIDIMSHSTRILDNGSNVMADFSTSGSSSRLFNGADGLKLATTATGIDVTGTVVADGLTVEDADGATIRIQSSDTSVDGGSLGQLEFYSNDASIGGTGVKGKIQVTDVSSYGTAYEMNFFTGYVTGGAHAETKKMSIGSHGDISFYEETGTTAKFFWDASAESLGIGTAAPESTVHIKDSGNVTTTLQIESAANQYAPTINFDGLVGPSADYVLGEINGSWDTHTNVVSAIRFESGADTTNKDDGLISFLTSSSGPTLAERMRIDSSGNVRINNTDAGNYRLKIAYDGGGEEGIGLQSTYSGAGNMLRFLNSAGTTVGLVSTNNTATTYATSSDYRLKTDAQPMTGASDRVLALKPVNFEWISDGSRVDGFLAHEAQAVVPEAVTGTKDAMRDEEYEVTAAVEATYDDDGNELTAAVEAVMGTRSVPDYQGIDQSKLVPLLTAALQEALNKIDAMEIRLAALENN
jgi:hypothetical protein